VAALGGAAAPAHAAESAATDSGTLDEDAVARVIKTPGFSPYAGRKFPTHPFFGDTHRRWPAMSRMVTPSRLTLPLRGWQRYEPARLQQIGVEVSHGGREPYLIDRHEPVLLG